MAIVGDMPRTVGRRRLPIIGAAPPPLEDRPICTGCNRHLLPRMNMLYGDPPGTRGIGTALNEGPLGWPTGQSWTGEYEGYGFSDNPTPRFHSLRCALGFALHAAVWFDLQGKTFRPRGKTK